jgi:hypothetical protein
MAHEDESAAPTSPYDASALPHDASATLVAPSLPDTLVAPSLLTLPSPSPKQQKAPPGLNGGTLQSCALEAAGTLHVAPPSTHLPPAALQELPAAWADGVDGELEVEHEVAP